jgi:hypothetical protein
MPIFNFLFVFRMCHYVEHKEFTNKLTDKLQRIWMEAVPIQSRHRPGICPRNLKKTAKLSARNGGVMAEIRTDHILNTNLESYRYNNRLSIYS